MGQSIDNRNGFSLIEVLVSVFLFAIVGAIATGLLNTSLTARDLNMASSERAEMIDRARILMREDFGQLVNRAPRQLDGRIGGPGFAGSTSGVASPTARSGETVLVAFTRAGRPNPGDLSPRGTLQYVEYVRADDLLIRRSWAYPDRFAETPAQEFVLLEGLDELEAGFLAGNSWVTALASGRAEGQTWPLPRAVRLTARLQDERELEFLLLTPEFPS
ncbi:type II secretion system minor pseudopilin GspJ [Hyphobacterium sp.]|uniref:type II secretion system minor pseudopilin GspJ n=1 Tax=Hyphobacterium sp. TaxID=2004662 RepID=UPI003BA93F17